MCRIGLSKKKHKIQNQLRTQEEVWDFTLKERRIIVQTRPVSVKTSVNIKIGSDNFKDTQQGVGTFNTICDWWQRRSKEPEGELQDGLISIARRRPAVRSEWEFWDELRKMLLFEGTWLYSAHKNVELLYKGYVWSESGYWATRTGGLALACPSCFSDVGDNTVRGCLLWGWGGPFG